MIFAIKYFKDAGWVGVKNQDHNYKPLIEIIQSYKNETEKLFVREEKTKYIDGINEYGIAIISSAAPEVVLSGNTMSKVLDAVIDEKVVGNTIVFSSEKAFLIEAGYVNGLYDCVVKQMTRNQTCVRSDYGLYLVESECNLEDRQNSDARVIQARADLKNVKDARMMLDAISNSSNKEPQYNPLLISEANGKAVGTSGQIMICPKELTVSYRSIFSDADFVQENMEHRNNKTWLEVLKSKKITSFKEYVER